MKLNIVALKSTWKTCASTITVRTSSLPTGSYSKIKRFHAEKTNSSYIKPLNPNLTPYPHPNLTPYIHQNLIGLGHPNQVVWNPKYDPKPKSAPKLKPPSLNRWQNQCLHGSLNRACQCPPSSVREWKWRDGRVGSEIVVSGFMAQLRGTTQRLPFIPAL